MAIYLKGKLINPTIFPDGTSQIWNIPTIRGRDDVQIEWEFESESEIFHLLQLCHLLKSRYIMPYNVNINIPYLPYARQDKRVSNTETFALITFAKFINSIGFKEVTCLDPHSHVAINEIERLRPLYPVIEVKNTFKAVKADLVCYPDKGACAKYGAIYEELFKTCTVYCEKIRDSKSGDILSVHLHGEVKDKIVLIVDDICDGGMTFIKTAELLYKNGAKEVHLFVSHGLFTKGLQPLNHAKILRVFTAKGEVDMDECYDKIAYNEKYIITYKE